MNQIELRDKLKSLPKKDPLLVLVDFDVVSSWQNQNLIKFPLSDEINLILKEIYEPLGKWLQNPTENARIGQFGVVFEGQSNPWSFLNQINTNYTCHVILINRCNKILLDYYRLRKKESFTIDGVMFSYQNQFQFSSNESIQTTNDKITKILVLLKHYKNQIFISGSEMYNLLEGACDSSMNKGDERQKFYVDNIKDFFNDIVELKSSSGRGDSADMDEGVDVWTTHSIDNISFQKKTHQVKGVGTIIKVEGGYKIKAPSVSRTSRCDYFVFVVGEKRILVLRKDYTKMKFFDGTGYIFFDEELKHKDIFYNE
jgi:hypothetical protein